MEDTLALHEKFVWIDWMIVVFYLGLTTLVGHLMRGKQGTIKDFFAAGRSLPWPAVTGSIVATEISALTFIGVPGMVFAAQGDWTYLQWGIGSIAARIVVGLYFVKAFYENEIYSPYDYVGIKLGEGAKRLITFLFFAGSILGQSVRVMVTAFILNVVTPMDFVSCIIVIGVFAVLWTYMGGMHTVIWTDVMQFFLFIFGGLLALIWMVYSLDGGWADYFAANLVSNEFSAVKTLDWGKMTIFDLRTDAALQYTLWVGIFAMPFQNMAAFGTDQLNAQRMFCCRGPEDARKAIIWSSVSQLITLLMLMVGAGLVAYYQQHEAMASVKELWAQDKDFVFPAWIVSVLPVGVSGLILAGAFAAAISSLDSILAALSQTSLSLIFGREKLADESRSKQMLMISRISILLWGIVLVLFTIGLFYAKQEEGQDLVTLAFQMVSYTFGPMLGIFLLGLFRIKAPLWSLISGTVVCILLAGLKLPQLAHIFNGMGLTDTAEILEVASPTFAFPWMYPITTFLMVGFGVIGARVNESFSRKKA